MISKAAMSNKPPKELLLLPEGQAHVLQIPETTSPHCLDQLAGRKEAS